MSRLLVFTLMSLLDGTAFATQGAQLIERTLAIVGTQAITLSDVQTVSALGLVEGPRDQNAAIEKLVERALILREVERYAPPEPHAGIVSERVADLRSRHPGDQFSRILAAGGFTEARLRAWIRDDLRIAAYLNQRFAAVGTSPTEQIADWVADLRRRTTIVELWKRQ